MNDTITQRPLSSAAEFQDFLSPESLYRDMAGPPPCHGWKDRKIEQCSGTSNLSEECVKEDQMSKYQVWTWLLISSLFH